MGEINPAISSVFVCDSEQKSVVCKIGALYMVLKDFFLHTWQGTGISAHLVCLVKDDYIVHKTETS